MQINGTVRILPIMILEISVFDIEDNGTWNELLHPTWKILSMPELRDILLLLNQTC
jgi:hypothetical protein